MTTSSVPVAPAQSTAGLLYDSRRDIYFSKPLWRGWLHLLWFCVSLIGGTLLLTAAHGPARVAASAVYVTSVSALFGASALYHRGNWSPEWRCRLQRVDHAMIFFLIAGTATPPFLLAVPGAVGLAGLVTVWTLAVTAAAVHLARMNAPEKLVGGVYLGLGWIASLALPGVWLHYGVAAGVLMLAGDLFYMIGTIGFHRRRPDPYPSVFGFHEVFHAWVCAAAACQFAAVVILTH